mmetsp:Transcript_9030/g.32492  ORF Transcript_9030/g.32492 Transcript_9030/m.32492 type:complete len:248 (+) Transcript_9030:502-1245(+)
MQGAPAALRGGEGGYGGGTAVHVPPHGRAELQGVVCGLGSELWPARTGVTRKQNLGEENQPFLLSKTLDDYRFVILFYKFANSYLVHSAPGRAASLTIDPPGPTHLSFFFFFSFFSFFFFFFSFLSSSSPLSLSSLLLFFFFFLSFLLSSSPLTMSSAVEYPGASTSMSSFVDLPEGAEASCEGNWKPLPSSCLSRCSTLARDSRPMVVSGSSPRASTLTASAALAASTLEIFPLCLGALWPTRDAW